MYDVIIVRYGEIGLKGDNQYFFMNKLIENIKKACNPISSTIKVKKKPGRIYIYPDNNYEKILNALKLIPGIVSFSPAVITDLDYEEMKKTALKLFKSEVKNYPVTFKVETNRANKSFFKNSMEINREVGAYFLDQFDEEKLSVDIHNPDYILNYDVRKNSAYIFIRTSKGPGGLPVGTSGKALLLLSGGIDSPVAGWLGMKRGLEVEALHFHSFPYTSERAKEKVIDLTKILSKNGIKIKLYISDFSDIQRSIKKNCEDKLTITIMRRMMFRIASRIARKYGNQALLTGENIGQVSSQTIENISVINAVTDIPVLRPLITFDKQEIIQIAKQIGTYETSILPYEDCCTIFVPEHPETKPTFTEVDNSENNLEVKKLVKEAVKNTEIINIQV
ncbi:MAG: tRNA uracil 4-sulfurtransferase ThiI [Bacillota bacterium]